eukprot:849402_1
MIAVCFYYFVQFLIAFHPYFLVLMQFSCYAFPLLLILAVLLSFSFIHFYSFPDSRINYNSSILFILCFLFCVDPCTVSFDSLSSIFLWNVLFCIHCLYS